MRKISGSCLVLAATAAMGLTSVGASAAVIAEYDASANSAADPTTVTVSSTNSTKWGRYGGSGAAYAGPPAAWNITVPLSSGSHNSEYQYAPTDAEEQKAATDGWKLSMNVQVNSTDSNTTNGNYSVYGEYAYNYTTSGALPAGHGRYTLMFRNDDSTGNKPAVFVNTITAGNEYVVATGGFHLYELVFDPTAGKASLFVDGGATPVLSGISPLNYSLNRVWWGTNNSQAIGSGDYALVRLETLPEPGSLALLGLGGLMLIRRRRS